MSKELKYPIKYAVLEVKEQGGWACGYQEITQGYIVSKCYVIESGIRYHSNGKNELTHKVVFPFKNFAEFRMALQRGATFMGEEIVPSYDACGNPYPLDIVMDLFDSYEEAHILSSQKNEEKQRKLILEVSISDDNWQTKYEKLNMAFLEMLGMCQKFEELITLETANMNVTDNPDQIIIKKLKKENI